MTIIIYNSVFIILLGYFWKKYSIPAYYLLSSLFALVALDLILLDKHLGFSVLLLFLFLIPFIPRDTPFRADPEKVPVNSQNDYQVDFRHFVVNYLDILKQLESFVGILVYERKFTYYKIEKIYPIEKFQFCKNEIPLSAPLFSALQQFENHINLTTADNIVSQLAELNYNSPLQTKIYTDKDYLIFLFSEKPASADLVSKINQFLQFFEYIKNHFISKGYNDALLELSKSLNNAITKNDLYAHFLRIVKQYIHFDVAFISGTKEGVQTIEKVYSDDRNFLSLEGYSVTENNSLINLSIENRCHLPSNTKFNWEKNYLFGEKKWFLNFHSATVFPIMEHGEAVGTISLLSKEEGEYNDNAIRILMGMTNMLEISLLNAKAYQKMEEMATTDGLTGLINHRTFQERFMQYLQRASRFKRNVALVLTDIDHFKSVNDSYGHPMGDEVLRRVASLLKKGIRSVDLVARYGGEEFVIILEDIDKEGVFTLTNRIREDIKKLEFVSNGVNFRITISMGFSLYPTSGIEKQNLIDLADKALYYSKKHGRDQVNCIENIKEGG
ncbi:GGDEF domain-containing protein [bacterium]|nr:GGDEF domain-containing protein [bacterium]